MKRTKIRLLVVERVSKTGSVKSKKVTFREKSTHDTFTPPPESKRSKRRKAPQKKTATVIKDKGINTIIDIITIDIITSIVIRINEIPDWPL